MAHIITLIDGLNLFTHADNSWPVRGWKCFGEQTWRTTNMMDLQQWLKLFCFACVWRIKSYIWTLVMWCPLRKYKGWAGTKGEGVRRSWVTKEKLQHIYLVLMKSRRERKSILSSGKLKILQARSTILHLRVARTFTILCVHLLLCSNGARTPHSYATSSPTKLTERVPLDPHHQGPYPNNICLEVYDIITRTIVCRQCTWPNGTICDRTKQWRCSHAWLRPFLLFFLGLGLQAEQAEEERAHDIGVQWHNDNDGGASTHSRTRYDGGRWQPAWGLREELGTPTARNSVR